MGEKDLSFFNHHVFFENLHGVDLVVCVFSDLQDSTKAAFPNGLEDGEIIECTNGLRQLAIETQFFYSLPRLTLFRAAGISHRLSVGRGGLLM